MKKTAAWLAVHALEQMGVRFTFGIPGVHNTELYDELNSSGKITPILVTHEGCAAFMADAVSRVSGTVGALAIVPAAGATHAASGIGEALLAGIPVIAVSGGVRTDLGFKYQLHDIDQHAFLKPLTKATFKVLRHEDVLPAMYEAGRIALSGEPGPVFIELPVNLQLFPGEAGALSAWTPPPAARAPDAAAVARAADLLAAARRPGIFAGWGTVDATKLTAAIAEHLQAPVATTLQGLSAFPASHPLHTGFGFGPSAVPAARNAFKDCDALLAVGTRFAEIATGSFGVTVPENLVHVDINPQVFGANYPAKVAIEGDARAVLEALLAALRARGAARPADAALAGRIRADKAAWHAEWLAHDTGGRVSPARFLAALRARLADDAIVSVDDGNHTYLTAEHFPVLAPRTLIVPTDFNCMGYAVPAAIGAKLACPQREVAAIAGDGAFMMTGLEIVTAALHRLGILFVVFHDGALSQISQAQNVTYARAPCSTLGALDLEGAARATGAAYVRVENDAAIEGALDEAKGLARASQPVIVDVNVDYSKPTAFTQGAVKTNFKRFPLSQKLRMALRVLARKVTG
jgi:acetolactate synthase-1/2/3 large subunit